MGTFRVGCKITSVTDRKTSARVDRLLVDTGSDYTWLPGHVLEKLGVAREKKDIQLTMANGSTITRSVGFVVIHVDKFFTVDEVVFAEPGDMTLLGARTLEGFNAAVNPKQKKLVAAGPLSAAVGERHRHTPSSPRGSADCVARAFRPW
jgi:predicted aspartyl protease